MLLINIVNQQPTRSKRMLKIFLINIVSQEDMSSNLQSLGFYFFHFKNLVLYYPVLNPFVFLQVYDVRESFITLTYIIAHRLTAQTFR